MVKSVSSLTGNGLRDWLFQQLSAALMTMYVFGLVGYFILHPAMDFYAWHSLFVNTPMRIATLLFVFLLVVHAWIGMWTVATDYLKCAAIRLGFLIMVLLVLLSCLIWTIQMLWG